MANKYIIVGGGAAGIAVSYKILQNSASATVHLFEAQSILGGRAKTDSKSIKNFAFDKGCVYIQDPKNPENPWHRIALELGFKTQIDKNNSRLRIEENGVFINKISSQK